MVVIRLSRSGPKKSPFYHVVVKDSRESRDGRFIERVGYFNPMARGKATELELNKERITHWIGKGAQLSGRVSKLVAHFDKTAGQEVKPHPTKSELKKAQQEQAVAAAKKRLAEEKAKAAEEAKAAAEAEKAKAAEEAKAAKAAEAEAPKEEAKAEEAPKEDAKSEE